MTNEDRFSLEYKSTWSYNDCPYFTLDDWGVCNYQIDWEKDTCINNCAYNYDKLMEDK